MVKRVREEVMEAMYNIAKNETGHIFIHIRCIMWSWRRYHDS